MPAAPVVIARIAPDFGRWAELLGLIRDAFAYMDGVIDPPSSAHRLTQAGLRDKSAAETGLVATVDGQLAGCAFLAERNDHFYLGKLAVAEGFRSRGIGRALVARAEDIARAADKPLIELQTRVELTGNHATFARLGFREVGRAAHEGFEQPTTITMRKQLS